MLFFCFMSWYLSGQRERLTPRQSLARHFTHGWERIKQTRAGNFNISLWGCLLCFLPTLVYFPNSGGYMFDLPINILTASLLALFTAVALLRRWRSVRDLIDDTPMTHALLLLLFCYALAVIMQDNDLGLMTGILRLAGLSCIILLWLLLGQMKQLRMQQNRLLTGIVVFSTLQALLAIAQTCWPEQMRALMEFKYQTQQIRPYGIFQQPNLLASFLATGLACAVWLWLQPGKPFRPGLLPAVLLISIALILTQSRTGAAGSVLALLVMLAVSNPQQRKTFVRIVVVMGVAVVLALLLRHQLASGVREFNQSNSARYELLFHSLQMIVEKPFSGWGFGHFEHAFARMRLNDSHYPFAFDVRHPHNELLYLWVEGGALALCGLGAVLLAWITPLWHPRRQPAQLMLWSLTLPIMLHIMVEFPLYQSLPHLWLLLLLCHLALRSPQKQVTAWTYTRAWPKRVLRLGMAGAACAMALFFLCGLQTNALLTKAERDQFQTLPARSSLLNPWIQGERYEFAEMVHCLMRYNQTGDEALLTRYLTQAKLWLQRHNDRNVFLAAIMIEWHRLNYVQARTLLGEALQLYPDEPKLQQLKAKMLPEWTPATYDILSDDDNS